jgi:hypothetical protein
VSRPTAVNALTVDETDRAIARAKDVVELKAFAAALSNTYPDDPRLGELLALIEKRLPEVPPLVVESTSGERAWRVEWHDAHPISSSGSGRVGVAAWVLVMETGVRLLTAPPWDRSPDRAAWAKKLEPYVVAALEGSDE